MFADVRGIRLAWHEDGDGEVPFVWGHGLTSSRADEDDALLLEWSEISDATRLVRYDARGHGESTTTPDPLDYRWSEMARDQLAFADRLGIDRFVSGGASLGAATALHAAVLAPERVVGLVLVIPPTAWETRRAQTDLYTRMAAAAEESGVAPLIRAAALVPPPDPVAGRPEWEGRAAARLRAADPTRLATVFRGAATADLPDPELLAMVDVPALILAWSGDEGHPLSTAQRLAEILPTAELSVASTWGELRTWTRRVADFLTGFGTGPAIGAA